MKGARIEHLMCWFDNQQSRQNLAQAEEEHANLQQDLQERHSLRCEDVQEYTLNIQNLRQQLGESEDLLEGVDHIGQMEPLTSDAPRAYANAAAVRRDWEEVERLRKQVAERREEIRVLRRQALDARRAAATEEARLRVYEELHTQEVSLLRTQLPSWPPMGVQGPEVELENSRRAAAEERKKLILDELAAQQARARLESERKLHREEVDLLTQRLRTKQGYAGVELPERATAEIRLQLEALEQPFSEFLANLGEPALPPVPKSTIAKDSESVAGLNRWVGVLAGRLSALSDRLEAEGAAKV